MQTSTFLTSSSLAAAVVLLLTSLVVAAAAISPLPRILASRVKESRHLGSTANGGPLTAWWRRRIAASAAGIAGGTVVAASLTAFFGADRGRSAVSLIATAAVVGMIVSEMLAATTTHPRHHGLIRVANPLARSMREFASLPARALAICTVAVSVGLLVIEGVVVALVPRSFLFPATVTAGSLVLIVGIALFVAAECAARLVIHRAERSADDQMIIESDAVRRLIVRDLHIGSAAVGLLGTCTALGDIVATIAGVAESAPVTGALEWAGVVIAVVLFLAALLTDVQTSRAQLGIDPFHGSLS